MPKTTRYICLSCHKTYDIYECCGNSNSCPDGCESDVMTMAGYTALLKNKNNSELAEKILDNKKYENSNLL